MKMSVPYSYWTLQGCFVFFYIPGWNIIENKFPSEFITYTYLYISIYKSIYLFIDGTDDWTLGPTCKTNVLPPSYFPQPLIFFFFYYFILRESHVKLCRLVLNSLCNPSKSWIWNPLVLNSQGNGIISLCHQAQLQYIHHEWISKYYFTIFLFMKNIGLPYILHIKTETKDRTILPFNYWTGANRKQE